MLTDDEIIYKYHGIDDCLHTNTGENGLAMREDGSIKCYDCGRVFDCLSDLTKDTAAQAIKLARASTTNQLFAELDPIIQTLDVNDQNCLKVIIAVQALKKKYKVD